MWWWCIVLLLMILSFWHTRKCWLLIWQLNGWIGVLEQPILWVLMLLIHNPKHVLASLKWIKKFHTNTLAVLVFDRLVLHVDDPATVEAVLNSSECQDKTHLQDAFFASRGLLKSRGLKWKERRKQLNPAFHHNVLLAAFEVFNEVGNQLESNIAQRLLGNTTKYTELEDLLTKAVLTISCRTTMGAEMDMDEEKIHEIARVYRRLLDISALKIIRPWYQLDFIFHLLDPKAFIYNESSNKVVENFVQEIVERKYAAWRSRDQDIGPAKSNRCTDDDGTHAKMNSDTNGESDGAAATANATRNCESSKANTGVGKRIFIEQIFHLADAGKLTLDDIMDESYSMILVSFETVSNSIAIALLCLAMHPDCQRELRKQIYSVFPDGKPATIGMEHLQRLKYLDMVINESLRLFATVPIMLRQVKGSTTLRMPRVYRAKGSPCCVTVPGNTIIALDYFHMQRNPQHWGPSALRFDPNHFGEPRAKRHPYAFVPFSKGLRWCIGWQYSIFVSKIILIKLIAAFELSTPTRAEQLQFYEGITLKFKESDSIKLQIRSISPESYRDD